MHIGFFCPSVEIRPVFAAARRHAHGPRNSPPDCFSRCRERPRVLTIRRKKRQASEETCLWSECRDSNSRPLEPHSSAIPNFATPGYSVAVQISLITIPQVFLFFNPYFKFFLLSSHFFLLTSFCGCGIIRNASGNGWAFTHGEMAEWSKAPVLKTGDVKASVGSNPTLSARLYMFCFGYAEVPKWPKGLPC